MTISTVFDHFRAVKSWTSRHLAYAKLDMNNLQLEVRCANRYFVFHPQFAALINGRLAHVSTLPESILGFGGWRPYLPYTSELSLDKLSFKKYLFQAGLRTPKIWRLGEIPTEPYIVKSTRSSFGYGITGPFPAGKPFSPVDDPAEKRGTAFAEEFVTGKIIKLWLWGATAIFADVQTYPEIVGDGRTTAGELARQRIQRDSSAYALADASIVAACLALQGVRDEDVPDSERRHWIDFRYGRTFPSREQQTRTASAWRNLHKQCARQLEDLQQVVVAGLRQVAPVPLACSVDGVLDEHGHLWWLELNSNPLFPHHGYDAMLSDLFEKPRSEPEAENSNYGAYPLRPLSLPRT